MNAVETVVLEKGARLGPYEVTGFLGAGGMGQVYRARDTRLGRAVAIKVLPRELSSERSRLARFEQEARSASALNHPNIVTIYDFGESEAGPYLAMELIEGESLREVMVRGPLTVRKLIDLASQIAEGLAKAHAAGIVHRDLKPENLMVSRDGFVKILDFGLAKLAMPDFEKQSDAETATHPGLRTRSGTVLGTVGYMSPEQASGKPVDFRSDQFSFGLILYEMATGQRAFRSNTEAETLAAIIRDEPEPIGAGRPDLPVVLRWVIERSLAKDPDERYASTQDLARDLRILRERSSEVTRSADVPGRPPRRRWLLALSAAVAGALVLAGPLFLLGKRAAKSPPLSFQRLTYRHGAVWSARFTPDGQTVVYGAAWDGSPVQLFETRIGARESRPLGLPGGDLFAVSSSGEMALSLAPRFFLTYRQDGTLARASLSGGAARELLAEVHAADWAPGGTELAIARFVDGKGRLEFPPGRIVCQTEGSIHSVRISPRGDRIAFMEAGGGGQMVKVVGIPGEPKALSGPWRITSRGLAWSASGEEIWFSATGSESSLSLYAVDLAGKERLVMRLPGGLRLHDIDRAGRVLASHGDSRLNLITSRAGEAEKELADLDGSFLEDLSPDGQTLILTTAGGGAKPGIPIYLRKTDGSPAVLLGEGYDSGVSLSPDGRWALAKHAGTPGGLVLLPTKAGYAKELQSGAIRFFGQGGWLADGKQILLAGQEPGHKGRLYVLDLSNEKIRALSEEGVFRGRASPDGRSVVAQAGRFGEGRILIYSLDGGPPRVVPGSRDKYLNQLAGWSADSRLLYFYRVGDVPVQVYRIDVETGEQQAWKQIAPADPAGVSRIHPVKVTPDGKSYAYSYIRGLSDLYVFDGLK